MESQEQRRATCILNKIAHQVIEEVRGMHSEYVFTFRGKPITRMLNSAWKESTSTCGFVSCWST